MNEHPITEAYVKPETPSLIFGAVLLFLSFMILVNISERSELIHFFVFFSVFVGICLFLVIRSKRKKKPILRITEEYIEHRFLWQNNYRRYYFFELAGASIGDEFPFVQVMKLDFKDGRKPVMIQMTNLDVSVEIMFKQVVERI